MQANCEALKHVGSPSSALAVLTAWLTKCAMNKVKETIFKLKSRRVSHHSLIKHEKRIVKKLMFDVRNALLAWFWIYSFEGV